MVSHVRRSGALLFPRYSPSSWLAVQAASLIPARSPFRIIIFETLYSLALIACSLDIPLDLSIRVPVTREAAEVIYLHAESGPTIVARSKRKHCTRLRRKTTSLHEGFHDVALPCPYLPRSGYGRWAALRYRVWRGLVDDVLVEQYKARHPAIDQCADVQLQIGWLRQVLRGREETRRSRSVRLASFWRLAASTSSGLSRERRDVPHASPGRPSLLGVSLLQSVGRQLFMLPQSSFHGSRPSCVKVFPLL